MSEFKGTPGPWFIKPVSDATVEGDLFIIQTGSAYGSGYHIAYASTWGDNEGSSREAEKNAKLLAAAPELLAFAIEFKEAWDMGMAGDSYLLKMANKIIDKALGDKS